MADNKCLVCGHEFQDKDYNVSTGYYTCPYCETKKKSGGTDRDFARTTLLTNAYSELSRSNLVKASRIFNDYIAEYPNDDNETYTLGDALVNSRISTCLNYNRDRLIPIIHDDHLPTEDNLHYKTIKNINTKIYSSVEALRSKEEDVDNIHHNALIMISLDKEIGSKLDKLLNDNVLIYNFDITCNDCELMLYKNIKSSRGLIVYVDSIDLLHNPYFLSIYYRFRAVNKNVILVYKRKDYVPLAFSNDIVIDINNVTLKDEVIKGLSKVTTAETSELPGVNIVNSQVVLIDEDAEDYEKCVILPTGVSSILSRAAYNIDIDELHITAAGLFTVGERAFSNSTLERLDVQNKNCNLIIEKDAFYKCKVLTSLVFSNTNIEFGIGAFRDCTSLKSIDFTGKNITNIPTHLFDGCRVFTDIKLPSTVQKIEKYAFRNTNLRDITLYTNMKIESKAFYNCGLDTVYIEYADNLNFEMTEDSFPSNVKFVLKGKETKDLTKYFKKNHPDFKVVFEK